MAASFFQLTMLVLHVCVLVPTLSGVTTIWAGREVALAPLFDREISDRMANYSINAMSVLTMTRVESVYPTTAALTNSQSCLLWSASS